MPTIAADKLTALTVRIFEAVGVDSAVAERTARHLVASNLVGVDSHGVMRVPGYVDWIKAGQIARDDRVEVLKDFQATAVLDGHATFGPVVASRASQMAIDKARKFGVGLVTVRNSAHIGRLGEYADDIARQGFIGFICCNSQGAGQLVAPFGARDGRMGTNPIAWGVPTSGDPIVIDMSTSAAAEGKIRVKLRRGEKIPSGWAIDAHGNDITDPAQYYGPPRGAILSAAGHKGYGLSLIVEALAGALSGGGVVQPRDYVDTPINAFTVQAIDIDLVAPLAEFTASTDALIAYIKTATPLVPGSEILIPNEPEMRERRRRMEAGIPIEDNSWRGIEETARNLGVELPEMS